MCVRCCGESFAAAPLQRVYLSEEPEPNDVPDENDSLESSFALMLPMAKGVANTRSATKDATSQTRAEQKKVLSKRTQKMSLLSTCQSIKVGLLVQTQRIAGRRTQQAPPLRQQHPHSHMTGLHA